MFFPKLSRSVEVGGFCEIEIANVPVLGPAKGGFMIRFCVLLVCLFLPCSVALLRADDVYLKNGGVLSGKVVYGKDKIYLEQADGVITLEESNVLNVEERRTLLHEFDERFSELNKNPTVSAAEFTHLGDFAHRNRMRSRSITAYKKALQLDPGFEAAGIALGYRLVKGKWLPLEEAAQILGLVKNKETWVTPELNERLIQIQAQAAADRARADLERQKLDLVRNELALAAAQREKAEADRDRAQALQHRRRIHHYPHHH